MTPYQMHILLPADNDIDRDTIMKHVHDSCLEGFDSPLVKDSVVAECTVTTNPRSGQERHTVSILYNGTWRCQIHYNDAVDIVPYDSQQWSALHASEYPMKDQVRIAQCFRRLDIESDPDPHHDKYDDFYTLSDHVCRYLGPCYSFDSIQNQFRRNIH
jgi:hypothetical protein